MKVYLGTEETTHLSSASGKKKLVLGKKSRMKAVSDVERMCYISHC